jgi:DNA-binding PadR family transcriptional regulator
MGGDGMNLEIVKKYNEKIPSQIIELVENLDTDKKWAVFIALVENEHMYFSRMKDLFDANPSELDRILKSLVSSGLIVKRIADIRGIEDNKRTYYEITSLGQKFFDSTFDLFIPKQKNNEITSDLCESQDRHINFTESVIEQLSSFSTIRVALRQE